jgi:hypothetical protein
MPAPAAVFRTYPACPELRPYICGYMTLTLEGTEPARTTLRSLPDGSHESRFSSDDPLLADGAHVLVNALVAGGDEMRNAQRASGQQHGRGLLAVGDAAVFIQRHGLGQVALSGGDSSANRIEQVANGSGWSGGEEVYHFRFGILRKFELWPEYGSILVRYDAQGRVKAAIDSY